MHESKAESHTQIQGTLTRLGIHLRSQGPARGKEGGRWPPWLQTGSCLGKHEVVSSSVSERILSSEGGVGSKILISLEVSECSHKT